MAVYYLYVYTPADFVGGLPDEAGSAAAGFPVFTLQLVPGAQPTLIAVDDADLIFDEVDATQSLETGVTLDGTPYAAGTTINTAYDLIDTGSGHRVTSFHLGGDGYQQGPVDGIVSTVELVAGTSYTFNFERTSHTRPNAYDDYVACFVAGSNILTPDGYRSIEDLSVGDMVMTLDDGPQPLRWVGHCTVAGLGSLAPVRIPKGWNGLTRDLLVSPHHRMMITGSGCELAVGLDSGLVSAHQLVKLGIARVAPCNAVSYHHIMFDAHQIVTADGTPSESLLAHGATLSGFAKQTADEIMALFPELAANPMDAARPALRAHEAMYALN